MESDSLVRAVQLSKEDDGCRSDVVVAAARAEQTDHIGKSYPERHPPPPILIRFETGEKTLANLQNLSKLAEGTENKLIHVKLSFPFETRQKVKDRLRVFLLSLVSNLKLASGE